MTVIDARKAAQPLREDPLADVYKACNAGDSKAKLNNLPAFPRLVDIEMTNLCNFRCLMCPTGTHSQKRPQGFMSDEVFYKVVDELAEMGTPIRFIRWGEPMMHPSIIPFLTAAKTRNLRTHMNTNGSYFTEENAEQVIEVLDSLKFSFQGVDRNSYAEMRNRDFFLELVETIKMVVRLRGSRPSPFIYVTTTITYETPEQIAEFRELMEPLVDRLSIGHTQLEFLDLNAVRLKKHEIERLKRLKEQESIVKEHPECPEVFDKLSINWDGTVSACCADHNNWMVIGDVKKQSLKEIWMSEKMGVFREMLADMRHDEIELCKTCYDPQSLSRAKRDLKDGPSTIS